jgi:hypothetical protein
MQLVLAPAFASGTGLKPSHALGVRHVGPYGVNLYLKLIHDLHRTSDPYNFHYCL